MNPIFSRCASGAGALRTFQNRCNVLPSTMSKCLCLLVLFLATNFSVRAQAPQLSRPDLNVLSPQTYEFVRQGNVPVSHFTGETNVRVPIYTYKDKDFELPIFLGYNSSGFRPSKRESIVGLSWYLGGAGGAITRQVHSMPDEREGQVVAYSGFVPHGLFYGIKNNFNFKTLEKDSLFNLSLPPGSTGAHDAIFSVDGCEMEPDEFTFSTPDGRNGKFFIEHSGNVKTSGNQPYRVDLSGLVTQSYNAYMLNFPSTIKITTDDGYIYYFGGSAQYLEISYHLESAGRAQTADIIGWHLSKIEAPNGRSVVFEYEAFQPLSDYASPGNTTHYLFSAYEAFNWVPSDPDNHSGLVPTIGMEATKTVYLKKIIIDNQTSVTFLNSEREKKFYISNPSLFNQKNLQLDAIEVSVAGNPAPVHRYEFDYEYLGGTHARSFLSSFGEVGTPSYRFDYYNTSNLPDPLTRSVDYWGFWTDRNTDRLIPTFSIDVNTQDITYTSNDKDPNGDKANTTLLQKIYYPTGGYTEFTYEPHEYRKRLERKAVSNFWPELFTIGEQPIAGGARIKTIIDHDGSKETNKREFKYVKTDVYPTNGPSSGILMNWPRYVFYYADEDGAVAMFSSNSYHINHYPGEGHMQYSDVTEINSPLNGCTTYRFTSYEDHPDLKGFNALQLESWQYLFSYYTGLRLNDHSFERGHPVEVTQHALKSDGSYYPVSKQVTSYTEVGDNPSAYTVGLYQVGTAVQSFKLLHHPFLPKEQKQLTYFAEGAQFMEGVTNTTYTATGYLSTQSSVGSDNKVNKVKYRYVGDFITPADDAVLFTGATPTAQYFSLSSEVKALVDMKRNNMLNKPVEVIQYVNDVPKNAGLMYYKDFANVNVSKQVYASQSWRTVSDITNFTEATINKSGTWTFNKHSSYGNEPQVTFDKIDDIGNPVEITDQNKIKVSYIWGYNKLYPVAEFAGAPVNAVFYTGFEDTGSNETTSCRTGSKCLSGSYSQNLSNLPSGSYFLTYWKKTNSGSAWELVKTPVTVSSGSFSIIIPSAFRIDDVRFYPSDKPVMINTFTHRPQGGMTSKTDSNNVTEYYSFDNLGRLKLIQDSEQNIIKSFDYQFQGN